MKVREVAAVLILSLAGAALSGPDDSYAAGITEAASSNAAARNGGEYGNPALLGLDRPSSTGVAILPLSAGLRSGELALPWPALNKYLFDGDWARYVTYILNESFGLWGISDDSSGVKRSKKLTNEMKDGVGLYFGLQVSPVVFSMNNISASLKTYVDLELKLPGGILLPVVSYENGLQRGNAPRDLSALRVDAIAATELSFKIGRPIDALPDFFDYLNLDRGAYGVGIRQILGHGYVALSAEKGSRLEYDSSDNAVKLDAKLKIVSAGTGINIAKQVGPAGVDFFNKEELDRFNDEGWIDTKASLASKPVTGWGWGVGAGAVFHNDAHFVSVDMQDIGLIIWNARIAAVSVEGSTKKLIDRKNSGSLKNSGGGSEDDTIGLSDYLSFAMLPGDGNDSRKNHVTYLPMSMNLGYTYYYDLSERAELMKLVTYLTASAGVRQQIVTGLGKNTFTPELSLGGSAGLLGGVLPLRYGIVVGGPENLGSVVSTGVNTRKVSFDISYKTIGNPFLIAKNGFEVATVFACRWGYGKKKASVDDIAAGTAVAAAPDTADDAFAKRLESARALRRAAKAMVDSINASLDSSDAVKKEAETETLLTPHDGEAHPPADHGHGHEPLPAHNEPVPAPIPEHDGALQKIGAE